MRRLCLLCSWCQCATVETVCARTPILKPRSFYAVLRVRQEGAILLPRAAVSKEDYPALQASLAAAEAPQSDGTPSGTYVLAAFVLVKPWADADVNEGAETHMRPPRKSRRAARVVRGDEEEGEWRLSHEQQDEGEEPQAQVPAAEEEGDIMPHLEEDEEGEDQNRFSFEVSSMEPCCIELAPTFYCRYECPRTCLCVRYSRS